MKRFASIVAAVLAYASSLLSQSAVVTQEAAPVISSSWSPTSPANTLKLYARHQDISGVDTLPSASWVTHTGPDLAASITLQPIYRASGPGGRAYFEYDGVDDTSATAAFASSQSQSYTIAIVWRSRVFDTGANKYLIDGIDSGARGGVLHWAPDNGTVSLFAGGTITSSLINGTRTTNAWHFGLIEMNGASCRVAFDNAAFTSIDAGDIGSHALTGLTVGSAFNGTVNSPTDWLEIVIWNGVLGSGDFQSATNYFNAIRTGAALP